jgi:hypothetical protein
MANHHLETTLNQYLGTLDGDPDSLPLDHGASPP